MVKVSGKSRCLSLHEKAQVLEDINKGLNVTLLAKKYGIAKSTVCSIKNKKTQILERVSNTFKLTKKCTLKKAELPEMEIQLYKWFLAQRERNMPVSGEMIKQKALNLCASLNISDFKASDGWLQRFKERYGVRFLKITGEKLSSQPELIAPFKERLKRVIRDHGLNEHQIYNADETGLYWRLLPDKTYVSLAEKTASGMKISKQRITFLGCTNASGLHKIKPLVIGKAKNPRCFKNFNNPLVYRNSKNAWMTCTIFRNWFFQQFVPEVRNFLRTQNLPEKALLLLDNAPSHPSAEELKSSDGNIFVMFMPPNVTPLIQPMDQNVLRLTKLHYRNLLLCSVVSGEDAVGSALNKLTLRDAMMNLASAWNKLSPQVIKKCWNEILMNTENDNDQNLLNEEDLPLSVLKKQLAETGVMESVVGQTISLLQVLQPIEYTGQDIDEWNKDEDTNPGEFSESEDCEIAEVKVSHAEAVQALNIAIEWAKQNTLDLTEILTLKNIQEKAVSSKFAAKKTQSKITSFFSTKD